jgi:hypothetical protein
MMARTGASVSGVRADVERLSSWLSWMERCLVGISRLTATAAPLSIRQSGDSVDADPTSGFREAAFTGAANGKHTEPHLGVDLRGAVALPNPEKLVSLSACDLCSPEADSLLTAPLRPKLCAWYAAAFGRSVVLCERPARGSLADRQLCAEYPQNRHIRRRPHRSQLPSFPSMRERQLERNGP